MPRTSAPRSRKRTTDVSESNHPWRKTVLCPACDADAVQRLLPSGNVCVVCRECGYWVIEDEDGDRAMGSPRFGVGLAGEA